MQRYTAINEQWLWLRKWTTDSNDAGMTHLYLLLCRPHSFLLPVSRVKHCGQKSESSKRTGSERRWEPLKIKNLYAEAWGCVRITHIFASGAATASTSIPSSGGIFAATGGDGGHGDEQEEVQGCKRETWERREQEENMVEAEGSVELEKWHVVSVFQNVGDDVHYIWVNENNPWDNGITYLIHHQLPLLLVVHLHRYTWHKRVQL